MASQPRKVRPAYGLVWHAPCFNGAVASQPRKGVGTADLNAVASCFNGAVASQPRKGRAATWKIFRAQLLQWGRGFSATEGRRGFPWCETSSVASMGPWLLSHGRRRVSVVERCRVGHGFNGAVASQPRKGRGDGTPRRSGVRFNGAVASQPRKDLPSASGPDPVPSASMGPWLLSHGRIVCPAVRVSFLSLQWGRGFSATEGTLPEQLSIALRGFNGAVASQPRKGRTQRAICRASWRFNGAVASQPRKASSPGADPAATSGFNGAVASQPRKARWSLSPITAS